MRRPVFGTAMLAAALMASAQPSTQPRARQQLRVERVNGHDAAAGEVLVKLRSAASRPALMQLADAETFRAVGRTGTHRVRSRSASVAALLQLLARHPDVEYVEPNYVVHAIAEPPDELMPQLWGLLNVGQIVNGGPAGAAGKDINASQAWDVSIGSPAHVVAVIDTGVDYTHPDLALNMWTAPAPFTVVVGGQSVTCAAGTHGFNAIALSCDPMDDHNHGTHVAGTIGASGGNGIGVVGVNWTTRMMGVKFMNAAGSGTIADAISALDFVMQARSAFSATGAADVRVLSNSWGSRSFSQALLDQIAATRDQDMLFVAAAGNNGFTNDLLPIYPASYDADNIVSVAATTNTDARAAFSNYGAVSVDLGAPGVDILSTTIGGGYGFSSGTSMAAPHVSGAAALVLSRCALDMPALKDALLKTVEPVPSLAAVTATGGRLDLHSAMRSCIGPPDAPSSLTATAGDTVVTLEWPTAAGAIGYIVKRADASGGPYTPLTPDAGSTTFSDSAVVNGQTYFYVVAARNSTGVSANSPEASATPKAPSDLIVSSLTVPGTGGAGATLSVSVTTRNQGPEASVPTATRLYLSKNSLLDASDVAFDSFQAVPALPPGSTHVSDLSLAVPETAATGLYYVVALADGDEVEAESSETNNRTAKLVRIGPDLDVSSMTAPASASAGGTILVSATTRNLGGGGAGNSVTRFYLSPNVLLDASDLELPGGQSIPALSPGDSSTSSISLPVPANAISGSYYLFAKADANADVAETNETNNTDSQLIRLGGDLTVSALSAPAEAGSGNAIAVTDTTKNQGAAPVEASVTRFYLSDNVSLDPADTPLAGGRAVPALTAGGSSTGTTMVTLPGGLAAGGYYLIASADDGNTVAEALETNNARARAVAVGPDLRVSSLSVPSTIAAGTTVSISDAVRNQGAGDAGASMARFYLSENLVLDDGDVPLGSRAVPSLPAGAQAAGTTAVTIPAGTPPGTYRIIARADAGDDVAESHESNNVSSRGIKVTGGS